MLFEGKNFNTDLQAKYNNDPRIFFTDKKASGDLDESLIEYALFVHSMKSAASVVEGDFNTLSALLSDRRQGIAMNNISARMITRSLSRNKRKLMQECEEKLGVGKRR